MKRYLSKLNWSSFSILMVLLRLGAAANENITTMGQWSLIMLFFSLPVSMFFLIEGRRD